MLVDVEAEVEAALVIVVINSSKSKNHSSVETCATLVDNTSVNIRAWKLCVFVRSVRADLSKGEAETSQYRQRPFLTQYSSSS